MNTAPQLHEGFQQITETWGLTLPYPMARRIDDGSLVFWHSPRRFTSWINSWSSPVESTAQERLAELKRDCSPHAHDILEEQDGNVLRYAYRLAEGGDDNRQASFYGFVITSGGDYIQLAVYFDDPASLADAEALWRSIIESTVQT
jgi:hypothetical protein